MLAMSETWPIATSENTLVTQDSWKKEWVHVLKPSILDYYTKAPPVLGLPSATADAMQRKQSKALQEIQGAGRNREICGGKQQRK